MKRPLLFIIMLAVMAATAVGQTQQGYVKTRGKLATDGKSIVPGVRLSNALVTIENLSPVKSGANGAFSFALPAGTNRYRLQGVELKGYTLADPDAVRQTHTYSKDLPLIVVLEDMKQREADLEAARKSVRNVMKREIRKKQDELDSLRDAHAITQAKYDSLVRDFWEYRQSSEKLVNEMAERYVSTDYDQLDYFNRQVQAYIESGQLTKADSMIRSKGSLEERFNRVKQYEATNAQRAVEIQQEQEALDNSRHFTQKEKDDLANDLYRQHLIFLQQPMMQDSALHCLKLRADLDTANLDAVWDYANLSLKQKDFYSAEEYYKMSLRNIEKLYAANPETYRASLAKTQDNLGSVYHNIHDYASSERYFNLALENIEKLYSANPEAYRADLAGRQNNMGVLYSDLHDYAASERYYKQALENYEKLYAANPETYHSALAIAQDNLANMYYKFNDYVNSEKYHKMALENFEQIYVANPVSIRDNLAQTQNNLAVLYNTLHDYVNSEKYYKLALENFERLYATNPESYRVYITKIQNNLGNLYYNLHDYSNSEKNYKLAMVNIEQLYAANPEAYRALLAHIQHNLGSLYCNFHDYAFSEKYYKLAMGNFEQLYTAYPEAYRGNLAMTYWNMMLLYANVKEWGNYDTCLSKAMELFRILYTSDTSAYKKYIVDLQNRMILRLNIKAKQYVKKLDYSNAISTIDEAISIKPQNAKLYDFKGEVFLLQGKEQEALKMWQKVLELNPKFLDDYPEGTNLFNGLKAKGLIK